MWGSQASLGKALNAICAPGLEKNVCQGHSQDDWPNLRVDLIRRLASNESSLNVVIGRFCDLTLRGTTHRETNIPTR